MFAKTVLIIFSALGLWSLLFSGFSAYQQHTLFAVMFIQFSVVLMLGAGLMYFQIARESDLRQGETSSPGLPG